MRFTRHSIQKMPVKSKWSTLDFTKSTIFTEASEEFLTMVQESFRMEGYNISDGISVDNRKFFFSYDGRGTSSENFKRGGIIVIKQGSDAAKDIRGVEGTLLQDGYIDEIYLQNPSFKKFYVRLWNDYRKILKAQKDLDNHKASIQTYVDKYTVSTEAYKNTVKFMKGFTKLGIPDGIKIFEFKNVIAEDTACSGNDIDLGDLEFTVDFLSGTVKLTNGTRPRDNSYNDDAFHPHHLSNSICLGSQEADMYEAISNFEIGIIQAILHKFAHSYTSTDDAGSYWDRWEREGNWVYVPHVGEDFPEEDCVYSDYHNEWILREEAVEARDRGFVLEDSATRDWEEEYVIAEDCYYSEYLGARVYEYDAVEMWNGEWMPDGHEDIVEYDGKLYYKDVMVTDINGDSVPEDLTIYSNELEKYILTEFAVEFEGGWYTDETLPESKEVVES